jgi:hypothetical protein
VMRSRVPRSTDSVPSQPTDQPRSPWTSGWTPRQASTRTVPYRQLRGRRVRREVATSSIARLPAAQSPPVDHLEQRRVAELRQPPLAPRPARGDPRLGLRRSLLPRPAACERGRTGLYQNRAAAAPLEGWPSRGPDPTHFRLSVPGIRRSADGHGVGNVVWKGGVARRERSARPVGR